MSQIIEEIPCSMVVAKVGRVLVATWETPSFQFIGARGAGRATFQPVASVVANTRRG